MCARFVAWSVCCVLVDRCVLLFDCCVLLFVCCVRVVVSGFLFSARCVICCRSFVVPPLLYVGCSSFVDFCSLIEVCCSLCCGC